MCGIAGFISENRSFDSEKLVSGMLDLIRYRGPDQKDVKVYDGVALGMARLSIIDREKHAIPYEDSTGNYAIVYNGEIYNHGDIRKRLVKKYAFKTASDAETVLYNYIENGPASFKEYNGMYAFALYDDIKKKVFIVRDKAGEKPLFYTEGKDFIAFASEMKCLLELVEPEFNKEAISYKTYEFTVGKETLFKNIYSLGPGEYMEICGGKLTRRDYWKAWDNLIEMKDNEKTVLSKLSDLIEDAVLLRTGNSVHGYGCFVSGGVDSALVACIAKPARLYTVHYDYDDFNELEYAQLVAKKLKKKLTIVRPNKKDFLRTRDKIAYHLDTPSIWTTFSLWMLLERAHKDVKVVLTGDGADEMFSGYHRYFLLYHDEQIHKLEAMEKYTYLIDRYYGSPVERYAKLINRCENKFDEEVNKYLNKSVGFYFDKINNDVMHSMGLNDFYTTMQVLLQMYDRTCMAFSVENRSPFLDHRLIQFAFSMPSKYKIHNGVTKWAIKEVAKKFIPEAIVNRVDKRGFSAPVNKWFEWDKNGKYNRTAYKNMVFEDWKKVFSVKGA
ncbi:MAG: asparagine synthase (glutamine-hydrolyzing) [Candidatus Omnitrophica bacterium]|nr:asparagine synthase (glutamine-hydrolyzing) [Candidatus Omnitrophota bacterium]